jgi:hypothetical protein
MANIFQRVSQAFHLRPEPEDPICELMEEANKATLNLMTAIRSMLDTMRERDPQIYDRLGNSYVVANLWTFQLGLDMATDDLMELILEQMDDLLDLLWPEHRDMCYYIIRYYLRWVDVADHLTWVKERRDGTDESVEVGHI